MNALICVVSYIARSKIAVYVKIIRTQHILFLAYALYTFPLTMQDNKILTLLLLSIDIKVSSDSKNEEFNRSSNM